MAIEQIDSNECTKTYEQPIRVWKKKTILHIEIALRNKGVYGRRKKTVVFRKSQLKNWNYVAAANWF